jgi:anthranilate phosphoribosyltransferase
VRGVGRLREVRGTWGVETFGLATSPFSDLKGGDVTANLATVEAMLAGRAPAGLVDTIVLNAALGLYITGRTKAIADGIGQARELLLGGAVKAKIAATREFYHS